MNHTHPAYSQADRAAVLADGLVAQSLFVRDAASPLSEARLREHLAAVHARLVDRVGALVAGPSAPSRRDERELRFMLDELLEALHRIAAYGSGE